MAVKLGEAKARITLDNEGHETVFVHSFVDGILDPNRPMLGPVRDGGTSSPTQRRAAGGR